MKIIHLARARSRYPLTARLLFSFVLAVSSASAGIINWTNTQGGSWFDAANWSPTGVPGGSDVATITNSGTYTVLVSTGSVASASLTLGGGSGTQRLVYGTSTGALAITNSAVQANGLLLVTNGGLQGALQVLAGGQLQIDSPSSLFFYNFALTNQGTVAWTNGAISVGGNNSDTTIIANAGLLQISGDNNANYGGGSRPLLLNSGTVRKAFGTGSASLSMDLINLPTGLVDVSSGTLRLTAFETNVLGGTFTAEAPGQIKFYGNQTDAGGTASGSGTIQFATGTFYLRTNLIPQVQLAGGDVYIAGAMFQDAGAITNLTLDGAQLRGTNRVAGTLTIHSGNLLENLTVQPGGQLILGAPGGSLLYSLVLANQGTVIWSGGSLAVGDTIISNGGTWSITGDSAMNYGGGKTPYFTNYGVVQKTGGTGTSSLQGITFLNQDSGIASVSSGTLLLPNNYTNTAGTLRLNGGTLNTVGTLGMTGGQLDGAGTIGADSVFDGGTVSPGQSGPGLLRFKFGLALGPNAALAIDGTGSVPGTQFDQLSLNGALVLNGCALQVTSLPAAPGSSFAIVVNNGASSVSGNFKGLPDNSSLTIGGQPFRIHYAASAGNDVVLVPDALASSTQLSASPFGNNGFVLLGGGAGSASHTVQATTNFLQWINVGSVTADAGGRFSFTDTNAGKFPYRFYRTEN